jgi:hypothetical protein
MCKKKKKKKKKTRRRQGKENTKRIKKDRRAHPLAAVIGSVDLATFAGVDQTGLQTKALADPHTADLWRCCCCCFDGVDETKKEKKNKQTKNCTI